MKPERKKGKNRWHKAGRKITNGNERFQTSALFKLADWLKITREYPAINFTLSLIQIIGFNLQSLYECEIGF